MDNRDHNFELDVEDQNINDYRRELPEFKQPRFDLHQKKRLPDKDLEMDDPDMKLSNNKGSISRSNRRDVDASTGKTAMFPFTVDAYGFRKGDWVKEILDNHFDSNYIGVVVRLLPKANKVEVRWPFGVRQQDPEMLLLINKEESEVAARVAVKVSNLVRVAKSMRSKGVDPMVTAARMHNLFGSVAPLSWISGSVEIAYPKKTASYTKGAVFVREMVHLARDMSDIYSSLDDEYKRYVGIL